MIARRNSSDPGVKVVSEVGSDSLTDCSNGTIESDGEIESDGLDWIDM